MGRRVETLVAGGVATLTVSNPPVNALGRDTMREIGAAFETLRGERGVRAVVLTGAGDKAFLAGADIAEFPELLRDPGAMSRHMDWCRGILELIEGMPQPVIAAVQANCVGGGLEVALLCDIIVADPNAKFGLTETRLGLIPGGGGTQRLPRRIGASAAKQMIMLGGVITAAEAQRIGIVNEVAEPGQAVGQAQKLAARLAALPAVAVQAAKRAVDEGLSMPLRQGVDREKELFLTTFASRDFREGFQAFLEKRKPEFTHE